MSTTPFADETTRDLHEPRARRYAEALAAAAAAEQRIAELVEQLTEHEWLRSQAESQVGYLRERLDLAGHQLIAGTDDPPPLDVHGLIDLTTGRAWVRATFGRGDVDPVHWLPAEASERGAIRYAWPIGDAGPFIALPDAWHLNKINRDARARDQREDAIRDILYDYPGYHDSEARTLPEIDAAVRRVVTEQDHRRAKVGAELAAANQRIRQLEAQLDQALAEGGEQA